VRQGSGCVRPLAESLERSGLDAYDTVFIHDPDDHWEQAVGQAYPALARLRAEGAVKAIGAGMNQTPMLVRFVAETDLDCVMVAGRYSLLDRSAADELLPLCAAQGELASVAFLMAAQPLTKSFQAVGGLSGSRPAFL
jgi:D-threo-aldose 1-dehydrogenase